MANLRRFAPILILAFAVGLVVQQSGAQQNVPDFVKANQGKGNLYSIVHVDIGGPGVSLADAYKQLSQFAADSRKDPGNVRFEMLQQDGRLNHFTIVEVWRDKASFEAHSSAAHTRQFRDKIQVGLGSPFDERLHWLMP
jgi:quinol monooxygenase YgiN